MTVGRTSWTNDQLISSHFSYTARNYLKAACTGQWTGRQGPAGTSILHESFTSPESPLIFLWGNLKNIGANFSYEYCRWAAEARSEWLYPGPHFPTPPSIHASSDRSLCGNAKETVWTSTVTLTTVVASSHWNAKSTFLSIVVLFLERNFYYL